MAWDPSQDVWGSEDAVWDGPPGFSAQSKPSALPPNPLPPSTRPSQSASSQWDLPAREFAAGSSPSKPRLAAKPLSDWAQNSIRPAPSRQPPSVSSLWDLPEPGPTRPANPQKPSPAEDNQGDMMRSCFPETQPKKGKYRNEHSDQQDDLPQFHLLTLSNPEEKRYHGDIRSTQRETVTIVRRTCDTLVTNEHGNETFHLEDIPVDPSFLQTTGTFRADVEWPSLSIPEPLLVVLHANNFAYPSKVQATATRLIIDEPTGHLLVQAPTGSGKTLAFVLGTLAKLDPADPFTQVICVAPTNELLVQLTKDFTTYGAPLHISVSYVSKTNRDVSAQVLLATPAQCINIFRTKGSQKANTSHVKFLLLDEADHLLNEDDQPEFFAHMQTVIKELLPASTRVLLFSATYTDSVMTHINKVLETYTELRVEKEELVLDNIKQYYIKKSSDQGKVDLLINVLREQVPGVTVVFINTGRFAQVVYTALQDRGYKCALLIGKNMTTEERFRTLEDFKRGFYTILLTTNVLARGIDNTHVSRVINFDIPIHFKSRLVDAETYLHRIGRSGRFNRPGIAISIVANTAETHMLEEVKRSYGDTCVIECIATDEDMKEKVRRFAEEVAQLDCEASA